MRRQRACGAVEHWADSHLLRLGAVGVHKVAGGDDLALLARQLGRAAVEAAELEARVLRHVVDAAAEEGEVG